MAVTIRDVAALAGVSPSTVSRTCRNNPSISEETKERVRRAAKQLGYAMEGISTPATRTVGVILPLSAREVYENPFYLEMIRGINQFCNAHQYVSTIVTGRDNDEILSAVRLLVSSGAADAFILLYSRQGDTVIDYLVQANLLYVLIGKAYAYANKTVYIDNDNFLAGQEATEYLIRRGHRRIAYLGSDNAYLFTADRKRGYQSALALAGLPLREDYCVEMTALDMEDAALRALIERADRPTAIVVSDDLLGVTLERVCLTRGLSIPEDISIISFNNSLFAKLTSPRLTSVDLNSFQLGIEAASQLISHIDHPELMATKSIIPHRRAGELRNPFLTRAAALADGYTAGTYTGRADGRNGEITVDVTFSEDAITDIVVKDHQETAGIADAAINDLPGEIVASQSLAVDAKSGATFTSEGIVNAVADAVAQAGGDADALRAVPVEKELSTETIEMTTDVVVVGGVMGDDSPSGANNGWALTAGKLAAEAIAE